MTMPFTDPTNNNTFMEILDLGQKDFFRKFNELLLYQKVIILQENIWSSVKNH